MRKQGCGQSKIYVFLLISLLLSYRILSPRPNSVVLIGRSLPIHLLSVNKVAVHTNLSSDVGGGSLNCFGK